MLNLKNHLFCIQDQTPLGEQKAALLLGFPSSRFYICHKETVRQREQSPVAAHGLQLRVPGGSQDSRAVGQREKLPGRALLPAPHKPPRWKTSPKVLALEWWGRMVPFPLGSWLRRDQLSCGCWTGRKGEKERQLSAKEVWGLPMSWCWFMCAAGVPIAPAMGLGGRGGRLGGRGGAPGCLAAVRAAQPPSQLLDLLSNNDGVLLTNLLSSFCLVVVGAGVHVRVPVNGTEQVPTAAVKT